MNHKVPTIKVDTTMSAFSNHADLIMWLKENFGDVGVKWDTEISENFTIRILMHDHEDAILTGLKWS